MDLPGDRQAFVARFGAVFEHSPWVAERVWPKGPFATLEALHREMMHTVRNARPAEILALLRAHPELAGREAKEAGLTMDSSGEQGRLGFTSLGRDEFLKMQELNRAYREKFGFPCIVALRLHATRSSVMAEMQRRLGNNAETEIRNALEQIGHITRGRLERLARGEMMGRLTTHVLDTANGRPGAGMKIELAMLVGQGWKPLKTVTTNKDGRTDEPLLDGASLQAGTYRLLFHVGEYFRSGDFLDVVPVRFGIADASAQYHVPLLCTPWGYTTYRGS